MIEIKITNPAETDKRELRLVANLLLQFAGESIKTETVTHTTGDVSVSTTTTGLANFTIAPNDRPDVGTDVIGDPDPATIFGKSGNATGAALAPSTAAVGPSSTVLAALSAISTMPVVPVPPVPTNVSEGTTAADPTASLAGVVDLDADGLPHDVRIHAATKSKNQDGRWKKKRGVDDAVVTAVETELRAVMSLPGSGAVNPLAHFKTAEELGVVGKPPAPPVPVAGVAQSTTAALNAAPIPLPSVVTNAATAQVTQLATAVATTIATASPAPANAIPGFAQLLPAVTSALAVGTLTEARVSEVLAKYGVTMLPQLAPRPDLVVLVAAELFPAAA